MNRREVTTEIDRLIRSGVPYKIGGRTPAGFDCEGYVRYLLSLSGIDLDPNIYAASQEFRLTTAPYQFLDVAVLRCPGPLDRHLAIFLDDGQWITHCSAVGISRVEFNRIYREISHVARHKSL